MDHSPRKKEIQSLHIQTTNGKEKDRKACRISQTMLRISAQPHFDMKEKAGWPALLEFLELFLNCTWFLKNP